ncbi:cadherin EGF LAG seven-pass G-type receptor fmi-1-like [Littorina saxatilis]|uniref:cadherin EGF LAG seven-pass G-type receptor fmi-1-like n=1 Tax=Littorina saxatilis TaxID=31220 RepID=UPI0038B429D8
MSIYTPIWQCRVIATENDPPSRQSTNTGTVTVTVVRNTVPSFVNSPYNSAINRTASDSDLVTVYTTNDNDIDVPFNQTDVSIIGRNDNGYFALGGNNTIVLQSAADLASDTRSSYTLVLQVRDRGERASLSSTAVVNINVVRNLFNPVCVDNNQFISINFTTPPGNTIGTFRATDDDPGQSVKYFLEGTQTSKEYFTLDYDNGTIIVKKALPSTGSPNYQLNVKATDDGFPSESETCQKTVHINVDPTILAFISPDYQLTISENNGISSQVVDLDTNPNDQVSFHILGSLSDAEWFNIDTNTGNLTVAKDLRTDRRVEYKLLVQATRQSTVTRQTATSTVTIIVLRNENEPVFIGSLNATVDERLSVGSQLLQLQARDADVNDSLTFRFDSPTADTDLFYLGPSSGLITLKNSLVGRTNTVIEIPVVVEDNAAVNPKSATATVTIRITGDTNPPRFIDDPYNTLINYTLGVGETVYTANARDEDLLPMGVFINVMRGTPSNIIASYVFNN